MKLGAGDVHASCQAVVGPPERSSRALDRAGDSSWLTNGGPERSTASQTRSTPNSGPLAIRGGGGCGPSRGTARGGAATGAHEANALGLGARRCGSRWRGQHRVGGRGRGGSAAGAATRADTGIGDTPQWHPRRRVNRPRQWSRHRPRRPRPRRPAPRPGLGSRRCTRPPRSRRRWSA